MSQTEKSVSQSETAPLALEQDRLICAAIVAFLYEENQDPSTETNRILPSSMSPWKLLARRESVG